MSKPKLPSIFFVLLLAGMLTACGGGSEETSSLILTEAAQIAIDGLTQTAAAASPTPTATEVPPTPTEAPTQSPTLEGTPNTATPPPTQQSGGSGSAGCLRAEMYYESPQDGTQFDIGSRFSKLWSFKNVGTCPWTPGFSVVFIEGDQMDADASTAFSEFTELNILPGERVTVEVTMFAPNTQGTYKGYWMLRSDNGTYFGLGPTGKSWFWVEIYAKH